MSETTTVYFAVEATDEIGRWEPLHKASYAERPDAMKRYESEVKGGRGHYGVRVVRVERSIVALTPHPN